MAGGNRAADGTSPYRAAPAGAAHWEGEVRGSTKQKAGGRVVLSDLRGLGWLSSHRGLGLQRREGWKPIVSQPKCQEKFMVKAGSCWCHWLPPFIHIHVC